MHGSPTRYPFRIFGGGGAGTAINRPRNIFRAPRPEENEAFLAGGIIPPTGEVDSVVRAQVHALMTRLEARMERGRLTTWEEPLAPVTAEEHAAIGALTGLTGREEDAPSRQSPLPWPSRFNPYVPSGYTYLLQFIAHDLVDSVKFATIESDALGGDNLTPNLSNVRHRPLMLDTVYGSSPDEMPQAYERPAPNSSDVALPRTHLRLFALRKPSVPNGAPPVELKYCPYADIARGVSPRPPRSARYVQPTVENTDRTEALVSDQRNDDHSLISQLLVLFHKLHNIVIGWLERTPVSEMQQEIAYRRFLCARFVTALIYRNIIRHDVLGRVLDPDVYEAYVANPPNCLALDSRQGIPLEFTFGAFRFGHAMVRENYQTNGFSPGTQAFSNALDLSSHRNGASNGLPDFLWAIDWAQFFGPFDEFHRVNLSGRLGPVYASGLKFDPPTNQPIFVEASRKEPADTADLRDAGLGARDLLSGAYAGLWSVPTLFDEIRRRLEESKLVSPDLLPSYSVWRESLRTWLKDYRDTAEPWHLDQDDIEKIVNDPPLPFFVMFEAAHQIDREGRPSPAKRVGNDVVIPGQGGRHLGRFGSILVAEAMFGALHNRYFGFDEFATPLSEGIERICKATIGESDALSSLFRNGSDEALRIDTMQHLLKFLQRAGAFEAPPAPQS